MTAEEKIAKLKALYANAFSVLEGLKFAHDAGCILRGVEPTGWQPTTEDTIAWLLAEQKAADGRLRRQDETPAPNAEDYERRKLHEED